MGREVIGARIQNLAAQAKGATRVLRSQTGTQHHAVIAAAEARTKLVMKPFEARAMGEIDGQTVLRDQPGGRDQRPQGESRDGEKRRQIP